jgi:hypothetical protein
MKLIRNAEMFLSEYCRLVCLASALSSCGDDEVQTALFKATVRTAL